VFILVNSILPVQLNSTKLVHMLFDNVGCVLQFNGEKFGINFLTLAKEVNLKRVGTRLIRPTTMRVIWPSGPYCHNMFYLIR
jgi:hypothetical protein